MSMNQFSWLLVGLAIVVNLVRGQVTHLSRRNLEYADPDRMGYYYCAFWKLADGTSLYSSCDPFSTQRCGRPLDFKYRCCSGFHETQGQFPDHNGYATCSKVQSPYESCANSLTQNPEIATMASEVGDFERTNTREPYTIFAPQGRENEDGMGSLYASHHIVKGRYYIDDLKDGMELETLDPRHKLFINKYPYGIVTINCIEVTGVDLECASGIVHSVRKPLTGRLGSSDADTSSVMNFLNSYSETQQFARDLPNELKAQLGDVASGHRYTVLAPRNHRWEEMRRKYSGERLKRIAASHVLRDQHCSSSLIKTTNYVYNIGSARLKVVCQVDEQSRERRYLTDDCGRQYELVESDLMAANGVIHLLEEPILPVTAMTLRELQEDTECARHMRITEFMKLLKECDLYTDSADRYAVVVPTDDAFKWWSTYPQFQNEYRRFQSDREYRCQIARYQVMRSDNRLDNIAKFSSNTMAHRTNNRIANLYQTTYFERIYGGSELNFNYAPIIDLRAVEMEGTSLYFSTRLNVFPEVNMVDILSSRSELTTTNNFTVQVDMNGKTFSRNAPKNLFLATSNEGWIDPSDPSRRSFRKEATAYPDESMEKFLLLHHIPLSLWGGDIGYFKKNTVHKFMSSAGVELIFWMDDRGEMRIGHDQMPRDQWPRVVQWNLPARDGIIWVIDGVLTCPEQICSGYMKDVDYYDLYVAACQTANLTNETDVKRTFKRKPIDVANRHPDKCVVRMQTTKMSVKYFSPSDYER